MLENAEAQLGRKIEPTIIVLDPPRAGCDERLIRYTASLSPKRIVYISCNPTTLARDAKIFKELGYEAGEVTPFDLFPATGHVESVVCLKRQIQQ
jgi:23S rRNA (uracil1939-C5)-methyltransferase